MKKKYYYNNGFKILLLSGSESFLTVDWWETLEKKIKKEHPNVIDFEFTSVTYDECWKGHNVYNIDYNYTLDCVSEMLPLIIRHFIFDEIEKYCGKRPMILKRI